MSRLFGDDFITQKYLRQYPDSERTRSWAGVMVHIQTENGVWRTGGSGYTWAGKPDAWIIPFEQAARQIDHCGPEKCGKFLRVNPTPETIVGGSRAIRKAGDAAVQKLVDRFALTHFMPGSDDLTDYLRSIVDACVKAATEDGQ